MEAILGKQQLMHQAFLNIGHVITKLLVKLMLETKTVNLKWSNKTKKYYEEKGYVFTNYGEEFTINVEDLSLGSNIIVIALCDYCLNEGIETRLSLKYNNYNNRRRKINKDCCKKCAPLKYEESCFQKYGVKNCFQLNEVKEKIALTQIDKYGKLYSQTQERKNKTILTSMEKYGTSHPSKAKETKDKKIESNLEKYGVENVMQVDFVKDNLKESITKKYGVENYSQTEEYREKFKVTSMKKYGVEHPFESEEVKNKIKQTNLMKYGYEYSLQSPEIRAKGQATLLKNGDVRTSSQQLFIYKILSECGYDAHLNYPFSTLFLDIALFEKGAKIDIEYDGNYWHTDEQRDRRKDEFLKSQGWKVLRIKSDRNKPSLEQINSWIEILLFTEREFLQVEI